MSNIAYIDNEAFEINEGETILSFVKRVKGEDLVPTLCDAPNLDPYGACRVCSVDVALVADGPAKAQASCHTPVMPNSYIYPSSDRIQNLAQEHCGIGAYRSSFRLPYLRSKQQL
jgi:formate dehydrogenase major subunit